MKNRLLIGICVIQLFIILLTLLPSIIPPNVLDADLVEYLDQYTEDNNYYPDNGYIPNAKTAKKIGIAIIDELTDSSGLGFVTIKYDKDNKLWYIQKNYLLGKGCFIVIEQESGKVIKALLLK